MILNYFCSQERVRDNTPRIIYKTTMKKIALLACLTFALVNCTGRIDKEEFDPAVPSTRVFVQGKMLGADATKGLTWPYVSEEGWETARFSLRVDNKIVDFYDKSSALYFGRKPNVDGRNRGKVLTDYPYGHYNDRDFDYEKVDKKTGNNIGLFRYVYDPEGKTTQCAILEAPLVEDILADDIEDLEAAIAAGKNVTKNTELLNKAKALVALGSEYLNSHVLWYVVKEVGMKNGWHVNGVIADNEPEKPGKVANNVEIDIHQQEHANWNEIKTSVHIRTDVESVEINIPIEKEDILEYDDFDIRVYKDYLKGEEYADAEITVSHSDKGINILIDKVNASAIKSYKESFGDGLTVEIHSFCKGDDMADIWSKVSKSTVVSTGKPVTVVGQITSAYFDDVYPVKVMNK